MPSPSLASDGQLSGASSLNSPELAHAADGQSNGKGKDGDAADGSNGEAVTGSNGSATNGAPGESGAVEPAGASDGDTASPRGTSTPVSPRKSVAVQQARIWAELNELLGGRAASSEEGFATVQAVGALALESKRLQGGGDVRPGGTAIDIGAWMQGGLGDTRGADGPLLGGQQAVLLPRPELVPGTGGALATSAAATGRHGSLGRQQGDDGEAGGVEHRPSGELMRLLEGS